MEIWKEFLDGYFVSNLGNIRHNEIMLKGSIDKDGYKYVNIKRKKMKVHRLVAIAFLENKDKKPQVNHVNGIKLDNSVSNLEWCTAKHNVIHSIKTGLNKGKKGVKVLLINNKSGYMEIFETIRSCSKAIGIDEVTVHNCLSGKIRTVNKKKYRVIGV